MNNSSQQVITRAGLSLFVILFGSFLAALIVHSSNLAIPAIANELSLHAEVVSWFTFIQALGSVCLVLPAGKLADIYGRKRVFCIGLFLAGVACLISGTAQGAFAMLSGRMLQGAGAAFIWGSSVALVASIPPADKKVQVMGMYIALCYLGIVIGPLFGGYTIASFHWRWVFFIPGALLILTGLVGLLFLHWEQHGDTTMRLRLLDVFLSAAALIMIALAVPRTNSPAGLVLMVMGLMSFAAFFKFQTKRRDPLLQVRLFLENKTYAVLGLVHFLIYSTLYALPFTLTLYLQYVQNIDAKTTGWILISQALITALLAPFSGWLATRTSVERLLSLGIGLIFVAFLVLTQITATSSIIWILLALVLIGAGIGLVDSQLIHVAMGTVPANLLGSASATMTGMRSLGGFVGLGLVSFLTGKHIGEQQIVPALIPDLMKIFEQFYLATTCIVFVAFMLLLWAVFKRQLITTPSLDRL